MSAVGVAVLGGGIMGRGIALALAAAGHPVRIAEPDDAAREALPRLLAVAATGDPAAAAAIPAIVGVATLEDAVADAGLVIEAVPERESLKAEVWTRIGASSAAGALLASNTSALDLDVFAALVPDPGRVVGMHWFNPAQLIPCVEIVRGSATTEATIAESVALLERAGKQPVVVKNSPGFVANRIQFALVREALLCLEEGIATAEDIDAIVTTSFGMRLAALGPLANADLGGLDTYASILEYLASRYGDRFAPPAVLTEHVDAGRLGTKTGAGIFEHPDPGALARRRDAIVRHVLAANQEGELRA